ncbi:MAG TPA: hypothetical protein VGP30_02135 [Candidatus Limnocylindrales bacterium]|nr:hypothetical protein [Candidatus Limnocylindrales bacterium]
MSITTTPLRIDGLDQPAISLGILHNFGEDRPLATQRAIVRRAFDLGVHPFRPTQQRRPAMPFG